MKISFLGDIALVGNYNNMYSQGINPFSEIEDTLQDADFVVGNLECLAEGDDGENLLKKPRLKTKYQTLNFLKKLNISAVSLAHNHAYDNLEDGFDKTINFLEDNNIKYLGAAYSKENAEKPIFMEKDGIKICFLNYVTEDTNPNLPDNCPISLNWFNEDKIKNDILKHRNQVNHIVLLLHWGGDYEGSNYPNPNQSEIAKRLIDYGADLIIGHHSHTFQPFEIYKDKYIFHSLGNFCFLDFESDGKRHYVWKQNRLESAIIQVEFSKNFYAIKLQPIINEDGVIKINTKLIQKYKNRNNYFVLFKKIWFLYIFFLKVETYIDFIFHPKLSLNEKILLIKRKVLK